MATTLEIVRGIHQAAANAYDGSHDERITGKDLAKEIGLKSSKSQNLYPIHEFNHLNKSVSNFTTMANIMFTTFTVYFFQSGSKVR